jgi:hypothetical protein
MKVNLFRFRCSTFISTATALAGLLIGSLVSAFGADRYAAVTLPFKVEVIEVPNSTLPAIHSFVSATADGKWLVFGGRTAGLHGLGNGKDNFPRSTANTKAYAIDPSANKVLGSTDLVETLPARLAGPLSATNPEFVQVGGDLYVVGGYGADLQSRAITTFGSIIKVDVARLISAITGNANIAGCFTQNPTPDNRLKVTGGGLKVSQGTFYLAFGQDFSGFYSIENSDYNRAGAQFQKYNEKVRVFTLNDDLSIKTFNQFDGGYDASLPYHRRDFSMVDIIEADGTTPSATVYGGVFRAGQIAGHTTPIDIAFSPGGATVALRSDFKQGLNHYDCANLTIFDGTTSSSFTTFFGGISQFHYDSASKTLVQDQSNLSKGIDGLPFIDTVSTIQHQRSPGAIAQFILPTALPGLVGTDAQFLLNSALRRRDQSFPNGVVKLSSLKERTLVGHIVGGIESFGPYSLLVKTKGPATIASRRLFEIWVTQEVSAVVALPPLPSTVTPLPFTQ